jgi:hypothetical protein
VSSRATAAVVLAALAAGAGAVAVVGACLPDLDPLNAPTEAGPPAEASSGTHIGQFCGDGLISLLDDGGYAGESCDPGGGDAAALDDGSTSGCAACQVVCQGAIDGRSDHCYFLVGRTTSSHDAFEACKKAGSHVVTVGSEVEANFASSLVADAGGGPFWLGLEYHPSANGYVTPPFVDEPGYVYNSGDSCLGCFGGASSDGGRLPPFDDSGAPGCVVSDGGAWFGARCDGISGPGLQTLCEREPPGQRDYVCGGALCTTVPFTFGKKRYVFDPTPVSVDQASQNCTVQYPGSRLVQLDSREEREELVREILLILGPGAQPTLWIGYRRDSTSSDAGWVWEDGDAGRPVPWASNEPAPGGGGRAYLRVYDGYDTALAATEEDQAVRYTLCERPAVPDGGP